MGFEILFTMLKAFSQIPLSDGYSQFDATLSKVNGLGLSSKILTKFVAGGISFQPSFNVHTPDEKIMERLASGTIERHSLEEQVMMRWASEWALSALFQDPRTHAFFAERLAFLLAS